MERLDIRYNDAKKAVKTLEEILKEPFSVVIRDAAIQRFEYTFEAVWKFLKEYLKEQEGIVSNSPKGCFKEAFRVKLLTEKESVAFLEMTDSRNDTSHTYKEEVATKIYKKLDKYCRLIKNLLKKANPA